MSENLAPARCTEQEWAAARAAGLPVFTTADEVAIHSFAQAIRAEEPASLRFFRAGLNKKLDQAYFLAGRAELTESHAGSKALSDEAEAIFAEVREAITAFRQTFAELSA